jgi:Tol biopolymer transport system component
MTSRSRRAAFVLVPLLAAPLAAQSTTYVSRAFVAGPDGASWQPVVSADGRYVAFTSYASNLVANDTNGQMDVFVRDLATGTTQCISVTPAGNTGNNLSGHPVITPDGRYVAFESRASNLVSGDGNFELDVFVRDLVANTTVRASVSSSGVEGLFTTWLGSISDDGRYVAFYTGSNNLVSGDTNNTGDVFVRDLQSGTTARVSVSSAGVQGNNESDNGSLSADGRYVAFYSWATNLVSGDTNGMPDIFVRDLQTGTLTRANTSIAGAQANNGGSSFEVFLSGNGRFAAFLSYATNLVTGDTNGLPDEFEKDLLTGEIWRVNVSGSGAQATDNSHLYGISSDGRYVVFESMSANLVPNDTNNRGDIFVHDHVTGSTSRASLGTGEIQGNDHSIDAGISSTGQYVAFGTYAYNLDPSDPTPMEDVYLRDRGLLAPTPFCFGDGTQTTACPCANSGSAGRGCENSSASGGALLAIEGFASDPDTAALHASGLVPGALTIFLQGNAQLPGSVFGDGVRCAGGTLKRLYVASAVGDTANAPTSGSLPLGLQSAFLGDPIAHGTSRSYQAWYRDSDPNFCAAPAGNLWNVSNGVRVDW